MGIRYNGSNSLYVTRLVKLGLCGRVNGNREGIDEEEAVSLYRSDLFTKKCERKCFVRLKYT